MFSYYCFVREVVSVVLYHLRTLCSEGLKQQVEGAVVVIYR